LRTKGHGAWSRSDGRAVAPNQLNRHFSMERGSRIMNYVQDLFCALENVSSLNVRVPTKDKMDDVKEKFPKYHIFFYLNSKVGREDIFKQTIGNESLHEISNDNRVKSSKHCHV
jgi:hypothetical protein